MTTKQTLINRTNSIICLEGVKDPKTGKDIVLGIQEDAGVIGAAPYKVEVPQATIKEMKKNPAIRAMMEGDNAMIDQRGPRSWDK